MAFNRYDIYWVKVDPARGSELARLAPASLSVSIQLNRAQKALWFVR